MDEKKFSSLTNEQKEQLQQEEFIAEVLKLRNSGGAPTAKSGWQKFLESSGGTALITVLIGGLVGTALTAIFQYMAKNREINLLNTQKFLEKREETTKNTFDLLSESLMAADDATKYKKSGIVTSDITDRKYKEQALADEGKIEGNLKDAQRKWISVKDKTFLMLSLCYKSNQEINESWKKVDDSLTKYLSITVEKCWKYKTECEQSEELNNNLRKEITAFKESLIKANLDSEQ